MDIDLDKEEEKWQEEYNKLDKDYYKLRAYFNRNRKCKCKHINICDHFEKALNKILGKRASKLCQTGAAINMTRFYRVMKED